MITTTNRKIDDYDDSENLRAEAEMSAKKMQFVHRAKRYELTREDFIRAVRGVPPARVQRYSVTIGKYQYPTRQVVALATGRPSIEFTSAAAYRILQKFGFDIDVWE
jgi:hypothetical protein